MMIKFDLLQQWKLKLNNLTNLSEDIIDNFFLNEANLNTEHLSYVFVLNLNSFNIVNLSSFNILAYNSHVVSDIEVENENKDMRLNSFKDN